MIADEEQQTANTSSHVLGRGAGFWRKGAGARVVIDVYGDRDCAEQSALQYRLNVWHRVMFDALDKRDGSGVLLQTMIFPSDRRCRGRGGSGHVSRMTLQRRWRDWLNAHVLDQWLTSGLIINSTWFPGDHTNRKYRVARICV